MTARRLDRRLLLTILLVIEVVRAAPASNAASAATSEPAPATTTDTALVDDSLPGSTVVYLPYYGGAAGQYLAVTRDPFGVVLDRRIVPADRVPGATQTPVSPEALERTIRALQMLAAEALAERGRTVRSARLRALAAASIDLLQLLWRSGVDIDVNSARYSENDVGEESEDGAVEVEADEPAYEPEPADEPPVKGLVADAKPVGIAVVGASGVAAARPMATALAASGVALARPVATAIAGLDPAVLGVSLDLGQRRLGLKPSSV